MKLRLCLLSLFLFSSITHAETLTLSEQYAEVNKDGTIAKMDGFAKDGLSVAKITYSGEPAYELTFSEKPERVSVEPQESANRELVKLSPKTYRVRFVGSGFGNPTIECNFTVTAKMKRK